MFLTVPPIFCLERTYFQLQLYSWNQTLMSAIFNLSRKLDPVFGLSLKLLVDVKGVEIILFLGLIVLRIIWIRVASKIEVGILWGFRELHCCKWRSL